MNGHTPTPRSCGICGGDFDHVNFQIVHRPTCSRFIAREDDSPSTKPISARTVIVGGIVYEPTKDIPCFGTQPSPQDKAENDCASCDSETPCTAQTASVVSLAATRFEKRTDPKDHKVRAALDAAHDWLNSLPEKDRSDHIIVICGRRLDDGGSGTRFFQAGSFSHHEQMGLLMEGQHMIRESGRDG